MYHKLVAIFVYLNNLVDHSMTLCGIQVKPAAHQPSRVASTPASRPSFLRSLLWADQLISHFNNLFVKVEYVFISSLYIHFVQGNTEDYFVHTALTYIRPKSYARIVKLSLKILGTGCSFNIVFFT